MSREQTPALCIMLCIYMLLLLSGPVSLLFMESVAGGSLGPKITLRPPQVIQGQNFIITCHTQNPGGTVHLEVNGVNITSPQSVRSNSTSFPFEAAAASHTGNYSCVHRITGHNPIYSDIVTVKVTVSERVPLLVIIAGGTAGGAVFLLLLILLGVYLTCKSSAHTEPVALNTYRSQPLEGEDQESEPDYMGTPVAGSCRSSYMNMEMQGIMEGCNDVDTPSEGSNENYVNVQIPEEDGSTSEDDYVNTKTMELGNAPVSYGDSDSEPDYENSAYLSGTAKMKK